MTTKHTDITPTLIPYLTVSDTRKAIDFYQRAFGFLWLNPSEVTADGTLEHAEMRYKDILIMFAQEGAFGSTKKTYANMSIEAPQTQYIYVDDTDDHYQMALKAGAVPLMEPNNAHWGDRVCLVKDPDGYEWMFAKPI